MPEFFMFQAGQRIGPYTLIRKLGKGGFGEVWLAEKRSQILTKKVAVKLPHDEQINFETIRREAELWEAASGHPNVLPIIDADVYDGQVVIVSEYASGGSLSDRIKTHGRLPLKQAVEMSTGILSGLDYLHGQKIIHRDIKPQNILLQGDTPRLADFGISRAMNTSTISSVVVGTEAYMAPEAFDGKRNAQTDIWSVGVMLYQLLAGSLPFPQEHPSERMFAVLTKQFEPLPAEIPLELGRIVQTALAKNPAERFQTAGAMRDDLHRALLSLDRPPLLAEPIQKPEAPLFSPAAFTPHRTAPTEMPINTAPLPPPGNQSVATNFPAAPPSTAKSVVTTFRPEKPAANPLKKILLAAGAALICLVAALGYFISRAPQQPAGQVSETPPTRANSANTSLNIVDASANSAAAQVNSANATDQTTAAAAVNTATGNLTDPQSAAVDTRTAAAPATKPKTPNSETAAAEKPAARETTEPPRSSSSSNSQPYAVKPIPGFSPAAKTKTDRRGNSRDSDDAGIWVVDDPDGVFSGTPSRTRKKPAAGNVNSAVVRRP